MSIILCHVAKAFGEKNVLQNFSHNFHDGRITCILGPSGCGKTTLLRLISGLEFPDGGTVSGAIGKLSMVFQEDRLFETLTAERNILITARPGFGREDAHALLESLGLSGEARTRPQSMSGGMRRRLALARALAVDYDLLLLDEPLSGLDGETRRRALDVIKAQAAGKTVIFVTHDEADAAHLGAEVLRMG